MNINELIEHWKHISPVIREPRNEKEYDQLARVLDQLLDIVGEDESHELMGLIDIVSHMISSHDEVNIEPILTDKDKNTLECIERLPNSPDDFFSEKRIDSKPQKRTDDK